jgi:hypothetical protein
LKTSLIRGALGFGLASLAVFATVAFAERWMYAHLGLYGAYAVWTLLFIALGNLALNPLRGPSLSPRAFLAIFSLAFLFYAVGWITAYFALTGRTGEWAGSLAGSLLLGLTFCAGFRSLRSAPPICALLFIANSLGYFLGDALDRAIGGPVGMLLWGVAYGLFLGAGLGASLHLLQRRARPPAPEAALP